MNNIVSINANKRLKELDSAISTSVLLINAMTNLQNDLKSQKVNRPIETIAYLVKSYVEDMKTIRVVLENIKKDND